MSLFGNSRGIAIQDKQAMGNHRQVWRTKRRNILAVLTKVHWGRWSVKGVVASNWVSCCWARRKIFLLSVGMCEVGRFVVGCGEAAVASSECLRAFPS